MNYLFTCPVPCNREIKVDARDNVEAVEKIILAGAISCRNINNRRYCEQAHFYLSPIPKEQLRYIVTLSMREESDASL